MSRPASCKSRKSEIDETLFGNIILNIIRKYKET